MVDKHARTVLLVDDDYHIRELFRLLLGSLGYKVIGEASNGREGVEKYRRLKPDAVILDLHMPVMDGTAALKAILAEDADAHVIMLTSEASQEMYDECLLAGAKRYIPKNAPVERIRERILESIQLPVLGG